MSKRRKKLLIMLIGLGLFLLFVIGVLIFDMLGENDSDDFEKLPEFDLYTPDYDINILQDPEYTELNRLVSYKNGAVTVTVAPEEYPATDPVLAFIAELTDTMIGGRYSEYPSFFSESYILENELPESFTMQRIYDITVERIGEEQGSSGENLLIYMLDYKISKNDGTLRRDIGSDSSKPWYLAIVSENGEYKIDNILTYSEK